MSNDNYVSMVNLEADTTEISGYNPEADANAAVPPFPAGNYSVMVSFASEDPEKIWKSSIAKDQQVLYGTALRLRLYNTPEGQYDGRTVETYVNTYTSKFSGTNSVQAALQGFGYGPDIVAIKSRGALAKFMTDVLAGTELAAEAEFDWEARHSVEEEDASGNKTWVEKGKKVGMKRFNKLADGSYDPLWEHDGAQVMARPFLRRWIVPTESAQGPTAPPPAPVPAPVPTAPVSTRRAPSAPVAPPTAAPAPTAPAPTAQAGPPVPPRRPAPRR